MESVIGVETDGEAKVEDSVVAASNSVSSCLQEETADPIVYKLVRVDGDGRLVPATDDEVMAVEDLLEDDKCEVGQVIDAEQTVECNKIEAYHLGKTQFENPQGQPFSEIHVADVLTFNVPHKLLPDSDNVNTQGKATVPPLTSEYSAVDKSGSAEGCSAPSDAFSENNLLASKAGASWKPDFSKLKGEICLENLTVKELHETFKAAFGRETSVKDKQWLKRRISMGLSNSCDFSCTSFVIEDSRVVKKVKENIASVNGSISKDPIVALPNINSGSSSGHDDKVESPANIIEGNIPNSTLEGCIVSEGHNMEQTAAKRVRKPTKRYIEELSEVESRESSGKPMSSEKICGYKSTHPSNHVISILKARPDGKPLFMRQDSLGGSGVQIPCVSRIRRGRPRENFMNLLNLQPNGTDMAAELVKNVGDTHIDQTDEVLKTSLSPGWIQQPLIATSEEGKHSPESKIIEVGINMEHENMDLYEDHSDDSMMAMPTPKGGMRRKHHRPWTLNEVIKLVEGVSRYGVGRWSEIKRLAFANCPYRTSVDLKDKWRNLLKASNVQLPAEKGIQNSRKHAAILIPTSILLQVRELAEMQGNISPSLNQSKIAGLGSGGRSADEGRVGYV